MQNIARLYQLFWHQYFLPIIVSLWVFIILHHGFHDAWPVTTHQVPWRHQLHHGSWWGFYMEALSALQLFVREIYQWPLTRSPKATNCIMGHDEAVTWESFLQNWPFVRGNNQCPLTRSPEGTSCTICHDEAVTWNHFLNYWPFVRGNHQWPLTRFPEGTSCTICHGEAMTW